MDVPEENYYYDTTLMVDISSNREVRCTNNVMTSCFQVRKGSRTHNKVHLTSCHYEFSI